MPVIPVPAIAPPTTTVAHNHRMDNKCLLCRNLSNHPILYPPDPQPTAPAESTSAKCALR
ncbi:unnamed protein product, partial [Oppiella nova]